MPQLPEVIQALLNPKVYPDTPSQIELVQTQMSFVFLADNYVYKLKKPVNLGYLDYTTLEQRRFYCQREVELNRRLCPDVYLGVVPILQSREGFFLSGQGKVVEYAVKMCRLPQEAMMNVLLPKNQVSPEMVRRVAQVLVRFHQRAETNTGVSAFGALETISKNAEENFTQTEKYIGATITLEKYRRIKDYADGFVEKNVSLFGRRIRDGKIRDCHGDLHAAHICFSNGIYIYDCIEFNDRFRYGDVASEVAFLAMDLDHYGRADLSHDFVNAYVDMSRDDELKQLLNFYKCYRAYVRGKVESFKLDDPYISRLEKNQLSMVASSYFDLAGSYVRSKSILFITVGLVGTGKTVLAQALARRLGLVVISSDAVRKQLAAVPLNERRFERFNAGIYSPQFFRRTYDDMFAQAKRILTDGGAVVLDASFIRTEERLKARDLAEEAGARFFILECTLDEETVRGRLARRLEQGSISDGRWEIFEPQQRQFEPVTEVPLADHIKIDTALPVDKSIRQIIDKVDQ